MSRIALRGAPRTFVLSLGFLASMLVPRAFAQSREISLEVLLEHARSHAPLAQVIERRQLLGEAARATADPLFPDNLGLGIAIGPRLSGADQIDYDLQVSLTQPIEIAGERGVRLSLAERITERLQSEGDLDRFELERALTLAYRQAQIARARQEIAERIVAFAIEMQRIAQRRLEAGDVTILDVRVASGDLAEARRIESAARAELRSASIRMAEWSGWPFDDPPLPGDPLGAPAPVPSLDDVLARSERVHPGLAVHRQRVAQARAQLDVADREAWPIPTVGAMFSREGSAGSPANYLVLGLLSVPLPIWRMNEGARSEARALLAIAEAERDVNQRALLARIREAHADLVGAAERVAIFSDLAASFDDGLALLRRGFEAGELPLLEVSVARERFLRFEASALAGRADYELARVALESAIGEPGESR